MSEPSEVVLPWMACGATKGQLVSDMDGSAGHRSVRWTAFGCVADSVEADMPWAAILTDRLKQ